MAEPLYSFQGREPEPLPERIRRLDNGSTVRFKGDPDPEIVAACGYTGPHEVPTDFDQNTHKCVWSPDDTAYVIVEKNSIELRNARNSAIAQMRLDRDNLLADSDKKIMPWLEKGQAAPAAWQKYRQALRDLPTATEDPFRVLWPREPMPHEVEQEAKTEEPKPRSTRRRKTT